METFSGYRPSKLKGCVLHLRWLQGIVSEEDGDRQSKYKNKKWLNKHVKYSLTFFFANFGTNATTFVVLAEIFPARLRSTCHGISAAAGKAGAIIGAFGFLYMSQSKDPAKTDKGYPPGIGVRNTLLILGGVNLLGVLFTFLVPESKGKSLEEMSQENEDDKETAASLEVRTAPVQFISIVYKSSIDYTYGVLGIYVDEISC